MKNAIILLLISLNILSNICNADDAVHLDKGQAAPYEGFEIDQAKVVKIRNLSIDLQTAQHVNDNLTQENSLLNQRLVNAQQQDDRLSKELVQTKDNSFFSKAGFFILGALITGGISYGVYRSK